MAHVAWEQRGAVKVYRSLWGDGVWERVPEAHALFPACPGRVLVIVTLG